MKETIGLDIFNQIGRANAIAITTNCTLDPLGFNPMGALAGQAAKRWEEIPDIYGQMLCFLPNVPVILGWIYHLDQAKFQSVFSLKSIYDPENWCALVAFPTMNQIGEKASMPLIIRSAELLSEMADLFQWTNVYLGAPGIGVGGLTVEEVFPPLREILNDCFTVMQK